MVKTTRIINARSAYQFYLKDNRSLINENRKDYMKRISLTWKLLPEEERYRYFKLANDDKQRYDNESACQCECHNLICKKCQCLSNELNKKKLNTKLSNFSNNQNLAILKQIENNNESEESNIKVTNTTKTQNVTDTLASEHATLETNIHIESTKAIDNKNIQHIDEYISLNETQKKLLENLFN